MKKLLYLLLCALPLISFTACSDDDDLPDVDFIVDMEGAVFKDGTIYAVAGTPLEITSVKVVNNEQGKQALISYIDYSWDYLRVAQSVVAPFGVEIYISPEIQLGTHLLEMYAPVYAVDKSPAVALLSYPVEVVASADDLPGDGISSFAAAPAVKTDDSK